MGTHRATRSVTHAHASGGGNGRVAGCPRSGGREGKGCDPYEKGSTRRGTRARERDRERGARTRRVRADALLSCGNVPILVKCTVSTWLRDNEDRGCRDLYALRHCVAVDEQLCTVPHATRYDPVAVKEKKSSDVRTTRRDSRTNVSESETSRPRITVGAIVYSL